MSYIDTLVLNIAYFRHDDREMWDVEPIFRVGPRYSRFYPIAKGTQVKATPPSQLWWPRSQFFGDSTLGDYTEMPPMTCDDRIAIMGHAGYQYRIRGVTKDENGDGVGGASVQLFRTSDDQFMYQTTSVGPTGQYDLGTDDNSTQYYVVAYRAGPDIEGTTVNTLTGS